LSQVYIQQQLFWSDEENAEWTAICLAHLSTIDYTLEAWTAVKYVKCTGQWTFRQLLRKKRSNGRGRHVENATLLTQ